MNELLLAGHRAGGGIYSFQVCISIADQVFSPLGFTNPEEWLPLSAEGGRGLWAFSAGAALITNAEVNRDFTRAKPELSWVGITLMQKAGTQMMVAYLWCAD